MADDGALDDGEPTPTLDLGLLSMVEDESANPLPSLAELDRRRAAAGDGSGGLPPPPAASELEPPPFELPSFELPGGGDGGGLGGLLGGLLGGGAEAPPPAAEADSKLPAINPGQKRVYEAEEKPPIEKFVFNLTWAGIAFLVLVEIFINTPLFQTVKPVVLGFMGDDSGAKAAAPSLAGAWDAVGVRPVFLPPDGAAAAGGARGHAAAPAVDSAADPAAVSRAPPADAAAKAAALLDQ